MTRADLLALADRKLWPRTIPEPNSGCLLWEGSLSSSGYGEVWEDGRGKHLAHRLSYTAARGEIPAGLFVLHKCDVRACVNPDHLFLGTIKDNSDDMIRKGRHPVCCNPERRRGWHVAGGKATGAKNLYKNGISPKAKLTPAQAAAIRIDRRKARIIAGEYGISINSVHDIRQGRAWRHA